MLVGADVAEKTEDALQRQTAVSAYLKSKQIGPTAFRLCTAEGLLAAQDQPPSIASMLDQNVGHWPVHWAAIGACQQDVHGPPRGRSQSDYRGPDRWPSAPVRTPRATPSATAGHSCPPLSSGGQEWPEVATSSALAICSLQSQRDNCAVRTGRYAAAQSGQAEEIRILWPTPGRSAESCKFSPVRLLRLWWLVTSNWSYHPPQHLPIPKRRRSGSKYCPDDWKIYGCMSWEWLLVILTGNFCSGTPYWCNG